MVLALISYNPKIHVVELAPLGFRFYRGSFDSWEEVPPRYTWRMIDYRIDNTIIYVDLGNSDLDFHKIID